MFKAILATSSTTLLLLVTGSVQAISERETFEVSVSIPTAEFYVIPSEADWIHREQVMPWNPVTGRLTPLRKNFDVRNVSGAIAARISAEPYLSNGYDSDNIPLVVTFNSKRLSVDADEVVSELDARAGKRVGLEVVAVEPLDGYKPGSYYGSVHMIFEALAP